MVRWIRRALLVLLAAAPFGTAQEERDRAKIPDKYKWNLAEIYPSDDAWRTAKDGYDLIKHDFSTYDLFGRWGFEMGAELTDGGWHLADRSLTNAEILLRLYRTLRAAAGDAVLLGCNTIGHLAAGLFEIQRTGDDTSGRMRTAGLAAHHGPPRVARGRRDRHVPVGRARRGVPHADLIRC